MTLGPAVISTLSGGANFSQTYTVTGTLGACTNTATAVINYLVPPVISILNSNPTICGTSGGTSNLTASSPNDPNYNYVWTSTQPTTLNTTNGNAVVASITTTASYTVTGTDVGSGCVTSTSTTVSQFDFPNIVPSSFKDTICVGDTTLLRANVSATNFTVSTIPFERRVAAIVVALIASSKLIVPTTLERIAGSITKGVV